MAVESGFKLPISVSYIRLFFIRVASGHCRLINHAGFQAFVRYGQGFCHGNLLDRGQTIC